MAKKTISFEPVITIKLRNGLAERNRLPLGHFLIVLDEFRQMMNAVGKRIERYCGLSSPSGDFGLEIVAGESGNAVRPGSVWSPLAITANSAIGVRAAQEIIGTLNQLEHDAGVPDANARLDKHLLRRISRIARIQRADETELEISMEGLGVPAPLTAHFGELWNRVHQSASVAFVGARRRFSLWKVD